MNIINILRDRNITSLNDVIIKLMRSRESFLRKRNETNHVSFTQNLEHCWCQNNSTAVQCNWMRKQICLQDYCFAASTSGWDRFSSIYCGKMCTCRLESLEKEAADFQGNMCFRNIGSYSYCSYRFDCFCNFYHLLQVHFIAIILVLFLSFFLVLAGWNARFNFLWYIYITTYTLFCDWGSALSQKNLDLYTKYEQARGKLRVSVSTLKFMVM